MRFAENRNVIETFAPDSSVDLFRITVFPGRVRCSRSISDSNASQPSSNNAAEDRVNVVNELVRRIAPRKRFAQLPCNPRFCRYCRYRKMDELSASMIDDN